MSNNEVLIGIPEITDVFPNNPFDHSVIDGIWKAHLPELVHTTVRFINGDCSRSENATALSLLVAEGDSLFEKFRNPEHSEYYVIYQVLVTKGFFDDSELAPEMLRLLNEPSIMKQGYLKSLRAAAEKTQ